MKRALPMLVLLALTVPLQAHELQTAVLRMVELQPGRVQATLKTPLARDGAAAAVIPNFPAGCEVVGEPRAERLSGYTLREWRLQCAAGLEGGHLRMEGLDPRTPDALVTLRFADGRDFTATVDRQEPGVLLKADAKHGPPPGLWAYLPIGIEHILLGPDHLMFVLGLMLVVMAAGRSPRMLVAAVTAFTLAHSLTLALAVLGVWGLPAKAVELLIALSIVLLAYELAMHPLRMAQGLPPSLTLRMPWLVAFAFGLLHGFGFAGALAEVGLPEAARGWALLLFNLGVEVGQLLFVAGVWLLLSLLRRIRVPVPATTVVPTLLGGMAVYWTLDRLMLWSASLLGTA